jgi:DNA recombination protein RmuC
MIVYILGVVVLIQAILVVILILRLIRQPQDLLLHQKLDSIREDFTKNILQTQGSLLHTQKDITEELSKLYKEIGNINRGSSEILTLTKSFHDILKPTKRRGVVGESILENIIKDVLPQEVVVPQHSFRNGRRVDFLIKLPQGNLAVDAKFSLETFTNYLGATEPEKEKYKRIFIDSVKRRIDEASSYILPDEGTLDFSFMYVPSEAIYYLIITETDILDYAQKKRVFVVGPNTFYVYLKTILVGFQALKIEKKAKIIYESLKRIELELENIAREYGVLGTHLRGAQGKYEEVRKRIDGVKFRLTHTDIPISEDEGKIISSQVQT